MPGNTAKRIFYSLAAAVIISAVCGVCLFKADKPENAAAAVYFIPHDGGNVVAEGKELARSVSQLRNIVTDDIMAARVEELTGISSQTVRESIDVEAMDGAQGAEIILRGLENPEESPIILGAAVNIAQKTPDAPDFIVISYCDISHEPQLPYLQLSISAGLGAALILFAATGFDKKSIRRRKKRSAQKAAEAAAAKETVRACTSGMMTELGAVTADAPTGLENSGHIAAAKKLLKKHSGIPPVIAVSPAYRVHGYKDYPFDSKFAAYLACAFARLGKHTVVIECNLKAPTMGNVFRKTGAGGISDIAAGNCAIWDALAIDARPGVDIITETKSYPAPAAIFYSAAFEQIMSYLSTQYDVMILHAPKAWECDEWRMIQQFSSGTVLVAEGSAEPDGASLRGIRSSQPGRVSLCRIKSHENEPEITEAGKNV